MTADPRLSIKQAFNHVHETWTPLRIADGRRQLEKKRVRRRVVRGTALALVAASIVLFVALPRSRTSIATITRTPVSNAAVASSELVDGALLLSDGSYAEPLASDTALAVDEDGTDRVRVALIDGAARFDVVPNPARNFVVLARGLRIEVIGTRFEVELESTRGHVRVLRGHVRVTWSRGRRDLHGGQSGLFPLDDGEAQAADAGAAPSEAVAPVQAHEAASPTTGAARSPHVDETEGASAPVTTAAPGDWRRLAREGDYDSAYRASREQTVGTDMEDLLLAADAARLSGHPGEAVAFLERALSLHSGDPRAHLAAFTLGRVHLQLGRNREAARDFAQVERLDRRRVLVEQALAREVEAWARAGDVQRARERAAVYLRRFPEGTYAERVRRFSSPP